MKIEYDEGYQFGLGAFETIAVENGYPIFLDWHLERLEEALNYLRIKRSINAVKISDFISNQDSPLSHHALKIIVSERNTVFTVRSNPYDADSRQKGISLCTVPVIRNEFSELNKRKTLNYSECVLAKRQALKAGFDEALMFNSRGEVCEGATTNIFVVKQGNLYTPSVDCGVLPGVVRRYLLEYCHAKERKILYDDLLTADACFVTNSLLGITHVNSIDGIKIKNKWKLADSVNARIFND